MSDVTQEDRKAYLAFNNMPSKYRDAIFAGEWDETTGMKILSVHRIAAEKAGEKAVLYRLLSEKGIEQICKFIHAGYELESPNQRKLRRADLAAALADALVTKR